MSASSLFFANRTVVIATMHRKEQVIAPLLTSALAVKTLVPPDFNTDDFGTFTRDIDRPADQLTTARLKATAALELTGETLAVASEGSFGPHPQIPFAACDRELVLLCDRHHQLEIVGEVLSTETNHNAQMIRSVEEALTFAKSAGFPDHGMVIMKAASDRHTSRSSESLFESSSDIPPNFPPNFPKEVIEKGINHEADLIAAVNKALSQSLEHRAYIETDMRALYNPTRMKVIAQATQNLIQKIEQSCPQCGFPGFCVVQRRPGLPCGFCGAATLLTLSVLYRCGHCQFQQSQMFPDSLQFADPGCCSLCNP
ncbi:MAG: DUF6671 family protein [Cyanobacteria bacterium J06588_5]